jgi:ABC-type nitrate/sulfonate/bicarbonate transport system permease component
MRDAATARPQQTARAIALHGFTVVAVAAWWAYSLFVPAYLLPGPIAVLRRMVAFVTDAQLSLQLAISLGHVAAAIALSFAIGTALAFAAHYSWPLRKLVDARLTPFLNAFSGIGWLFLAIIWLGIDSTTVIFAVTMILIPFATINLRTGLIELDTELVELGRSLSRSRLRRFVKLLVPMLVPYVFATLRTSFGVAWKVTLTAELFGGNAGVGYLLNMARQEFETETIFAIILFILLFVACVETLFFRPLQWRLDRRYRHAQE